MKRIALFTAAALLAASGSAYAQGGITLGFPSYAGTGCPAGSAAAALSPDGTSLSILFDQFVVSAGQGTGRASERKTCNVAIPVTVPQGLSVSIISIDYRGFTDLPAGANANFSVEYFFSGSPGPRFNQTFNGPLTDSYLITNNLLATALVWSACGADVILRTNPAIRVATPGGSNGPYAEATVDSEDVSASIIYHLQWRSC